MWSPRMSEHSSIINLNDDVPHWRIFTNVEKIRHPDVEHFMIIIAQIAQI